MISQASGMGNPGGSRYAHIDAMRAFAVLLVVVAHAGLGHIVPDGSGVTIFFAISGFIITHLVLREHGHTGGFNVKGFYTRRALKLAPPFLVIVAIPTAIYALWHPVRWSDVLGQVFFVFNWIYMSGDYRVLPGSAVVWSLAVEEQFYIGFALIWMCLVTSPRRVHWLAAIAGVVAIGSLAMRIYIAETAFSHQRVYYGTDTRIDGIALGVLAAAVYAQLVRAPERLAVVRKILGSDWIVPVAVAGYLFSLIYRGEYFRETFRYSIQAAAATSLVLYGLVQKKSRLRMLMQRMFELRPIQVVGLASYSIYLVHLSLDHLLLPHLQRYPKAVSVVVLSVAGVGLGALTWRMVELPVERFKQRLGSAGSGAAVPSFATRPLEI